MLLAGIASIVQDYVIFPTVIKITLSFHLQHTAWKIIDNGKQDLFLSTQNQSITITPALLVSNIIFPHLSYSFFVGCKLFDMWTKAM